MRYENLEGKKFGRLTAIEKIGSDNHRRAVWLCDCICGTKKKVSSGNLKGGLVISCGCSRRKQ